MMIRDGEGYTASIILTKVVFVRWFVEVLVRQVCICTVTWKLTCTFQNLNCCHLQSSFQL